MDIFEPDSAERDWEREQQAERRYQRERIEPPCTCQQMSADLVDVRGCESHDPDLQETGCTEVEIDSYPRIDIKPVRWAETAQGELFDEEKRHG